MNYMKINSKDKVLIIADYLSKLKGGDCAGFTHSLTLVEF